MKEPYIGSVRFFKNIILAVVIIMILVPTIFAFVYKAKYKEAQANVEKLQAEMINAEPEEEPRTATITDKNGKKKEIIVDENDNPDSSYFNMKTETMDYQELYPDFFAPQPLQATNKIDNTVYFTFDGGPSYQTENILNKLAESNVKATFFVKGGTDEESKAIMKKIVDQGHTIGIYASSTDYEQLYSSVESYLNDAYAVFTQIVDATGVKPTAVRFPGGSTNSYNKAIYQELIAEMLRRGFAPCDWNVQAMDDDDALTSDDIVIMAVSGSEGVSRPFIRMKDSESSSATVDGLTTVIAQLKEKGYDFKAIQPDTMPVLFSYPN